MDIQLKEVTTRKELRTFILYPTKLYKGNPYYVPSLLSDDINTLSRDKNPVFAFARTKYWLAYRDGKIVGRVAVILTPKHEERWGHKYMRFGWLDFIDDPEVLKVLMGAVEGWAREEGMEAVHGPLGFTGLDREGMLGEGFDELATLAILVWHLYHVIFDPDIYPINRACLDGRVTPEWQHEEHPLETKSPEPAQKDKTETPPA